MATIDTVTDSGEMQAAESEPTRPAAPTAAAAPVHQPGAAQLRTMTLVVTAFGGIITALLGGMFIFMVSAIDGLRTEIGSRRAEMHAEIGSLRNDMNRGFDRADAVLLDHTDRLARIETTLDISGRPVSGEASTLSDP